MEKHASLMPLMAGFRSCAVRLVVLFVWLVVAGPLQAAPLTLSLKAERLAVAGFVLDGIAVSLVGSAVGVRADQVQLADASRWRLRDVALQCASALPHEGVLCSAAPWAMQLVNAVESGSVPLGGSLTLEQPAVGKFELTTGVNSGEFSAALRLVRDAGAMQIDLQLTDQLLQELPAKHWLPEAFDWIRTGTVSGKAHLLMPPSAATSLQLQVAVHDLGFDSPAGRYAGEALSASFETQVILPPQGPIRAKIKAQVSAGELLVDSFYTDFAQAGLYLQTEAELRGRAVHLSSLRLDDGKALSVEAEAWLDLASGAESLRYRLQHLELYFPQAYGLYFESVAAAWALDGLTLTGTVLWTGAAQAGAAGTFESGVLDVLDLSIVDTKRGRFAVTGLDAQIRPDSGPDESRLSWRGLLLRRINLGAGAARLDVSKNRLSLKHPLQLSMLNGTVAIERLQVVLPGAAGKAADEAAVALELLIDDLDMRALTEALEWPPFEGRISGRIPGVSLDRGVLAVDGEIDFSVFDGHILLNDVQVERPFGVLPSLAGNLEVRGLDLLQLTRTFSFGHITGQISGYMHDLRMLDWKPVEFDAWFGTPPDQKGTHTISRNAVSTLTNIGGGGATAALSGPLLRMFSNFSYRRLGLGCRLKNYVCDLRGLDEGGSGVLIMEGAGLPKIMIRAFNRSLDWPQMLANLAAASAGENIRVGDKP